MDDLCLVSWSKGQGQHISYAGYILRTNWSSRSIMMGDLDLLSQGHSLVVYILKTI
jgi:hypothetical protein